MTLTGDRPAAAPAGAETSVAALRDEPPDLGRVWHAVRSPVGVALVLAVVVVTVAVLGAAGPEKPLDPRDASPSGARALAVLLEERGVAVHRATDARAALAGAGPDSTVLVPDAVRVSRLDLQLLARAPAHLVVVGATGDELSLLRVPARVQGRARLATRDPSCPLPAARTAGDAETGGVTYAATGTAGVACYAAGGQPTLLVVTAGDRPVALLGSAELFTNDHLAHRGNAALALGLLAARDVRWLVPPVVAAPAPASERKGVFGLLPDGVRWALVTVVAAVVLLALWRARRLGPVVAEPLPVVVRAAETVEGRARLYRAAAARGAAAAELRAATRTRLAHTLGLAADPDPATLVERVAARAARSAPQVATLLYGAGPGDEPPDDAALVRLATMLDDIEHTVRRG